MTLAHPVGRYHRRGPLFRISGSGMSYRWLLAFCGHGRPTRSVSHEGVAPQLPWVRSRGVSDPARRRTTPGWAHRSPEPVLDLRVRQPWIGEHSNNPSGRLSYVSFSCPVEPLEPATWIGKASSVTCRRTASRWKWH